MDRETWHAAIHGVTKSRTRLSNLTELNLSSEEFNFRLCEYKLKLHEIRFSIEK